MKKENKTRFLIPIGECGGQPIILNVNYIETIAQDGDNYVFTMKSGKVYRVAKSSVLTNMLMPFVAETKK